MDDRTCFRRWKGNLHFPDVSVSQFYKLKLSAAACSIWKLAINVTPQPLATYFSPSQDRFEYLRRHLGFFLAPPYSNLSAKSSVSSCVDFSRCQYLFLATDACLLTMVDLQERRVLSGAQVHWLCECVWVNSSTIWWNIHGDTVSALPFGPHYK